MSLTVIERLIKELNDAEYNPRTLSESQFADLKASLERFGAVDPALVNMHAERKNIIIGGHQRIRVAKQLGWKKFPCVELDLTRDQERELNIRLNKNTGSWDWDLLADYFGSDELLEWGFEEGDLFGKVEMDEPDFDDLVEDNKDKPPTMKITFKSIDQLKEAEDRIDEILSEDFPGAYFSVSAGEV